MISSARFNLHLAFLCCICVFLWGCGDSYNSYSSSGRNSAFIGEKLQNTNDLLRLDSVGYTDNLAQKTQAMDPLQAHMNARKQVKANDRSAKRRYTATANIPGDAGGRSRTLYVEKGHIEKSSKPLKKAQLPFKTIIYARSGEKIEYTPSAHQIVPTPNRKPVSTKPAQVTEQPNQKRPKNIAVPKTKPQKTAKLDKVTHTGSIVDLRKGEHGHYTRIVIDLDGHHKYEQTILEGDTVLMVKFPHALTKLAQDSYVYEDNQRLQNAVIRNTNEGGSIFMFNFKNPVVASAIKYLPPAQGKSHRLMIDIKDR